MKIDVTDGSLIFESGTISPRLDRLAFLKSCLGRTARVALVNKGWENLDFEPEPGIGVTAFFKEDRLKNVFFSFKLPADDIKEWVEDRERQRKAVHEAWLRTQLGEPPYAYPWGNIESDFDPRGWSSEILVTYSE
jgi:hypothetical protein